MPQDIVANPPLLTPANVQQLSTQLAALHQAISDADRIERCGFECGDIRATLHALSQTISTMLVQLGNVPIGAINAIGAPMPQGGNPSVGGGPVYQRCPDGSFIPVGTNQSCPPGIATRPPAIE